MKIGILTYFSAHNYGAFLQAYALQKVLSSYKNCDVEIINYRSPKEVEFYSATTHIYGLNRKNIIVPLKRARFYKKRFRTFENSIKSYQVKSSTEYITDDDEAISEELNSKYDLIIVGSDEIWKLDTFRGFPNLYWLPNVRVRKLSYAASARNHIETVNDDVRRQVSEFLASFEYIGVRDNATKQLIETISEGKYRCYLNCDPTFLYDFHSNSLWGKKILRDKFGVDGNKKVVALMIGNEKLAADIVKLYGNMFQIVSLYTYCPGAANCPTLTPFEWADVIAAADGVITTFFHATVFSIKNNTKFLAIDERSDSLEDSKLYDLLHRNGIADTRFLMYSEKEYNQILYSSIGKFMCEIADDKVSNYSAICDNERKLAFSFISALKLTDINVSNRDARDCCGCGLCMNICPKKAIFMERDCEGFYRPTIDNQKCIECGLCQKMCPNTLNWNGLRTWEEKTKAFAFKIENEDIRMASRSGGAFTAITDWVLSNGGTVYGAVLSEDNKVVHIRATDAETRDRMRGSKYVQSDISHIFSLVKNDLRRGLYVAFSGTPCQVASVKKFLSNENCERLVLIDILCHGVPSSRVWEDYCDLIEKKFKGEIAKFDFRNKTDFGWDAHVESFWINDQRYDATDFTNLFLGHCIINPACGNCKFKSVERVSDITLGDFWGINEAVDGFNDNKGVSVILINSEKGMKILEEQIIYRGDCVEVPLEACMQNSMKQPYPEPVERERFWNDYNRHGINFVIWKNKMLLGVNNFKNCAYKVLKNRIKKFILICRKKGIKNG